MKKNKKIILILFGIVLLIILGICYTNRLQENDIFYSIKVGETIKNYGVDFKDHFSWIGNLRYDYPHWFMDLIVYFIYTVKGFPGIYHFTLLFFISIMILFFLLNIKRKQDVKASLIISIITLVELSFFASARAQIVTYLLFMLEIYFIELFLKKRSKLSIIALLIIPIIIVNVHTALFYFYFILYLPYLVEYFIAYITKKFNIKLFNSNITFTKNDNVKYLLILLPFAFLTGFISPLGIRAYTYYPLSIAGGSIDYIVEHNPMSLKMSSTFYVIILLVFLSITMFKVKIKAHDFFLILGLTIMVFVHFRNYALFLILGGFTFCDILSQWISIIPYKKIIKLFLVLLTGFILFKGSQNYKLVKNDPYVSSYMYPKEASKYIKENLMGDDVRLFNDFNYGSYLILQDIPVFIDSRAELYTETFNKELVNFFPRVMNIEFYYEEIFEEYNITHVLVGNYDMLHNLLKANNKFKKIYEDDYFSIYELEQ